MRHRHTLTTTLAAATLLLAGCTNDDDPAAEQATEASATEDRDTETSEGSPTPDGPDELTVVLPDDLDTSPGEGQASDRTPANLAQTAQPLAERLNLPDPERTTDTNASYRDGDTALNVRKPDPATIMISYTTGLQPDPSQPTVENPDTRYIDDATALIADIHPDPVEYTWYYSPALADRGTHIVTATATHDGTEDTRWRFTFTNEATLTQINATLNRDATNTTDITGRSQADAANAAEQHILTDDSAILEGGEHTLATPQIASLYNTTSARYEPTWIVETDRGPHRTLYVPVDEGLEAYTDRDLLDAQFDEQLPDVPA